MKIRSCYVSNSSSSSFLIIGDGLKFKEVGKALEDGLPVTAVSVGTGPSGDCGDEIAAVTEEEWRKMAGIPGAETMLYVVPSLMCGHPDEEFFSVGRAVSGTMMIVMRDYGDYGETKFASGMAAKNSGRYHRELDRFRVRMCRSVGWDEAVSLADGGRIHVKFGQGGGMYRATGEDALLAMRDELERFGGSVSVLEVGESALTPCAVSLAPGEWTCWNEDFMDAEIVCVEDANAVYSEMREDIARAERRG